jgi:hypothetical protein
VGSCEYGNEPSGSINVAKFFSGWVTASQERLSSTELVILRTKCQIVNLRKLSQICCKVSALLIDNESTGVHWRLKNLNGAQFIAYKLDQWNSNCYSPQCHTPSWLQFQELHGWQVHHLRVVRLQRLMKAGAQNYWSVLNIHVTSLGWKGKGRRPDLVQ